MIEACLRPKVRRSIILDIGKAIRHIVGAGAGKRNFAAEENPVVQAEFHARERAQVEADRRRHRDNRVAAGFAMRTQWKRFEKALAGCRTTDRFVGFALTGNMQGADLERLLRRLPLKSGIA